MSEEILNPLEAAERQRSLILKIVRLSFFILIVTIVLVTIINDATGNRQSGVATELAEWYQPLALAAVICVLAFLIDFLTPNKKIATLGGLFLGLLAGLLASVAMSFLVDLVLSVTLDAETLARLPHTLGMVKLLLGLSLCYLSIITVLQTQDDFRLVIPYVEFSKQIRGVKPLILDTSALIDGRIVDLAGTGLIQSPLVVPRFVLTELHALSDSSDRLKRGRGRRGLDAVSKLQRQARVEVMIEDSQPAVAGVDQALVEVAKQLSGRLLTTDLGLTRVGEIHGVMVLNLHEIANVLRPTLVPGEQISLNISKVGEQPGQGVGYLDDGTMVVVEQAAGKVGHDIMALVSSTMQTGAGRLVFAKMLEIVGAEPTQAPIPTTSEGSQDALMSQEDETEHVQSDSIVTSDPQSAADATPNTNASIKADTGSSSNKNGGRFPGTGRKMPTGRNPRR